MSIDNDLQPSASITEGDRALDLFTDRYSFTRLLAERLNDPPSKEILFFHGAGGNGKSLLLKYLRTKVCKGLTAEQWQRAKPKKDDELAKALEELQPTECLPVPTALLDFAQGASGDKGRDSDPFYGLVRIREELAAATAGTPYRLKFPLHTYGCFLYLHKSNRLSEVDSLFPFEEAGLIKDFVELFQPLPGVGIGLSALGLVNKYSGDRLTHYKRRFGLDEAAVQRLQGMDAESELILELPRLLAQDLNVAMGRADAPERIVLFFDTHEAFYGAARDHAKNFFRDGWLRRLLRRLDTETGIVVVVSGRDKPRWAEAGAHELNTQIPADYVCLKSVDDLAVSDAEIFLVRAGVEDAALRESLIRYASVEAGAVHPLHLGLCADVVLEAAAQGVALVPGDFSGVAAFQEKSAHLIEQLLKWVDDGLRDAIRAVSACRAFDFEIYRLLGEALSFAVDRATFRRLVGFSFVRQVTQRGDEWFRIHDLLRRLGDEAAVRQAHEVLAAHYQEQGEIEAIYHVNRLDWSQGVDLWVGAFDEALKVSRYELCRALLDLRQELTIQTPFKRGLVANAEGQYFQTLSQYDLALQKLCEAIEAYHQDLVHNPDNVATLNNKGLSLQRLADLQAALSQHEKAEASYAESIAAYDAALHRAPDDVEVLNNKGLSLRRLADLQAALSQHEKAEASYAESIAAYDAALHRAPDDVGALNNKGNSLQRLADLQAALSQHEKAEASYAESIAAYDAALHRAPDDVGALNNKGNSLQSLADLQAALSQHEKAEASYAESIAAYDAALHRAPDYVGALNNKGLSLQSLADLQAALSQHEKAEASYAESIAAYDAALHRAPDDVEVLNNKGTSLQSLADLQAALSQHEKAEASYAESIAAYDAALHRAPDLVQALNNKGTSLQSLADLQAALSQHEKAEASYAESIAAYDAALHRAPDLVQALNNKGNSLRSLADLQAALSQHEKAEASYAESIAAYDAALHRAPDLVQALNNKGLSLQSLADLQAALSQHEKAEASYAESIAAYDAALHRAPDYVGALNNKGNSLQGLASLLMQQEQLESAIDCFGMALSLWGRSLQIAPGNTQLQQHHDQVSAYLQSLLDNIQSAITAQSATIQQTPDDTEALTNQAGMLSLLAKLQIALSSADAAIASYTSAVALYQGAIALNPTNWQYHFGIGSIRLQLASLLHSTQIAQSDAYGQQALEDWNRAVELNPDSAELQERRDWLLTELQKNELA